MSGVVPRQHRLAVCAVVVAAGLIVPVTNPLRQAPRRAELVCRLIGIPRNVRTFVPPPAAAAGLLQSAGAQITIVYVGFENFPAAQSAMEFAAGIWGSVLHSPVPIVVRAEMIPMGGGSLGVAAARVNWRDFQNAPLPDTWYGDPLANRASGTDLFQGYEIEAYFNSVANWYFGVDGQTPFGSYDFVSVALHEIGHGLNVFGYASIQNGEGTIGSSGSPGIYDRFAVTEANVPLLGFPSPSTTLAEQLTRPFDPANPRGPGVYFAGPNAIGANGGLSVRLHTSAVWQPGSSYSHLDESTYSPGDPSALMTPFIAWAEANHHPGPVTLGLLDDLGWSNAPVPPLIPVITRQPTGDLIVGGQPITLSVAASGSLPLAYQWYQGASPDASNPISGATGAAVTVSPTSTSSYWVRVSNQFGSADSFAATVTTVSSVPGQAIYLSSFKTPACLEVGDLCDTGPALVSGRGNLAGGPEPHQPNTLFAACSDSHLGQFHDDESIDRVRLETLSGGAFAAGVTVSVEALIWAASVNPTRARVDLYHAADPWNPTWTPLTTFTPVTSGPQTVSTTFVLPDGALQVIRAQIRNFSSVPGPCPATGGVDHDDLLFAVSPNPNSNLVKNGGFDTGMTHWLQFALPDATHLVSQVTAGVLEFYRIGAPPGTPNQAVMFQETGIGVPASAPLVASFELGNTSTIRKRISVLIHDQNFSDLSVCTFWLPPNAPRALYEMRTHTTKAWRGATISFYAASTGSSGGFYQIDNVTMVYAPAGSAARTDCVDPTALPAPGGPASPTLLVNGDFNAGTLLPWGLFGQIVHQIVGGIFEFYRPPGTPSGVVLQGTGVALSTGEIVTAEFRLGNSSSVRKRVTVLLHDGDFSDLAACTFWLPPGQALQPFSMRAFATEPWLNATVSVYPATVGIDSWIQLDDVVLQRTPGAANVGTECAEPTTPAVQIRPSPNSSARVSSIDRTGGTAGTTRVGPPQSDRSFRFGSSSSPFAGGSAVVEFFLDTLQPAQAHAELIFVGGSVGDRAARITVQVSHDGVSWITVGIATAVDEAWVVDVRSTRSAGVWRVRFVIEMRPGGLDDG